MTFTHAVINSYGVYLIANIRTCATDADLVVADYVSVGSRNGGSPFAASAKPVPGAFVISECSILPLP